MKGFSALLVVLVLLAGAGCKPKAKNIPPLQRKEAASLVSEAQFAMVMRDLARAEPLYDKATKLCPDNGDYWLALGMTRRRMANTVGTKNAYEHARAAFHDAFEIDRTHVDALLQELYVLCLLGRVDEARTTFTKARKKDPANPQLRAFEEGKQIDHLMQDSGFKQLAL